MNGFGVDTDTLPDLLGTALDLAFNQNTGIGLTYMRMGMAPDGSPQGPGGLDGPWTNAQAATARGAHVWPQGNNPPAAWKTNGSTTNGAMLLTQYYGAYAQEVGNFAHTAAANGVPSYAFSVQTNLTKAQSTTRVSSLPDKCPHSSMCSVRCLPQLIRAHC